MIVSLMERLRTPWALLMSTCSGSYGSQDEAARKTVLRKYCGPQNGVTFISAFIVQLEHALFSRRNTLTS